MYNDINEMTALQDEITKRYDDDNSSRFREAWRTISDSLESITEDNSDMVFNDLDELIDDYERKTLMAQYNKVYTMSFEEAEEKLQNCLDDKELQLIRKENDYFCEAESDAQWLDASEVDQRLAQILGAKKCIHWATEDKIVVLIDEE